MREKTTAGVDTEYGTLEVTFTGLERAHVGTRSGEEITVRSFRYTVSVHLRLDQGVWRPGKDLHQYVRKLGKPYGQDAAAPTIARAIVDACGQAALTAVANDPTLPHRAEDLRLTNALETARSEHADLVQRERAAVAEIDRLFDLRERLRATPGGIG
jgi:hypothetical protein